VRAVSGSAGYTSCGVTRRPKQLAQKEGIDILTLRKNGDRIAWRMSNGRLPRNPKAMSKMRQVIAQRLDAEYRDQPHFFVTVSVDMTDLVNCGRVWKSRGNVHGEDFISQAVVLSLKDSGCDSSLMERRSAGTAVVHLVWRCRGQGCGAG